MKHIKFILVTLLTVIFFSSCNNNDDDEIMETIIPIEITHDATLSIINTSNNKKSLLVNIGINGNPDWVYGKINNIGGEYTLQQSGDTYSIEIPIQERDFLGVIDFSITITIDDPRADFRNDDERLTTETKEIIWINLTQFILFVVLVDFE